MPFYALMGTLGALNRTRVFDVKDIETINVNQFLQNGHVTVFDVSDCIERLKNVVIYDLLIKVFDNKLSGNPVKTIVVIEEAHSFVSRRKSLKMFETIEMLREIARQGGKCG